MKIRHSCQFSTNTPRRKNLFLSWLFLALCHGAHCLVLKLPPTLRASRRSPKALFTHLLAAKINDDKRRKDNQKDSKNTAEDIAKRLSSSNKKKPEAPSSQPPSNKKRKNKRTTIKLSTNKRESELSVLSKSQKKNSTKQENVSFSSLLPPPLPSLKSDSPSSLSSGLSSWEEFLGRADSISDTKRQEDSRLLPHNKQNQATSDKEEASQLPSISDLFPPDLKKEPQSVKSLSGEQSLDGVLPVSELFYRSSQAIVTGQEDDGRDDETNTDDYDEGDDEELPFSAEQSDTLTTDDNQVRIRRNRALEQFDKKQTLKKSNKATSKRNRGRKLIRRGMDMFLGGTPINADPPLRSIELTYKLPPNSDEHFNWASVITLNTKDFGPLLHTGSASSVSRVELGLYCEHFVSAAMKWDVCPKDLRDIAKSFMLQQESPASPSKRQVLKEVNDAQTTASRTSTANGDVTLDKTDIQEKSSLLNVDSENDNNILTLLRKVDEMDIDEHEKVSVSRKNMKKANARKTTAKGFGKTPPKYRSGQKKSQKIVPFVSYSFEVGIGISKEDLESDNYGESGAALRRVFQRGLNTHLKSKLDYMSVRVLPLEIREGDDGLTILKIDFNLEGNEDISQEDVVKGAALFDASLYDQLQPGAEFVLALAAAAKEETAWPEEIRNRVVEEFLLEDRDVYDSWDDMVAKILGDGHSNATSENSNGASGTPEIQEDDVFGHKEAFSDYSESNAANAPFQGKLGPFLVDIVTARAVKRPPRVIAIGDVHGCIDELQDLLRLCDYRPGDQVVFLGDLVSKGPDSISVVQMAREIGAIAVRGNHDFEVIRWHQAIKAGVDPPVVGSEHFHIASCLSQADMEWMHCQPWYMASKELGALFVHAGFVSGIRLSKQNPRLMMNMRSILPDGTVTSKFFNNWPWARLWDGPQTVLFGHDADRGLQQYEHAIGLDTGCVYGGRLTACILPEKRLVSVSARRAYFYYRRKHYD